MFLFREEMVSLSRSSSKSHYQVVQIEKLTSGSAEVKAIFDSLIVRLIRKIKEQISSLVRSQYASQLRFIILSGGLGSSKYVKQRIIAEICANASRLHNGGSLNVLVARDPQLAVVKGLVLERAQTVEQNIPVWSGRCCRVSYGILCRRIYNPKEHFGEPTVKDPLTGVLWVEDLIDWIIEVVRARAIIQP